MKVFLDANILFSASHPRWLTIHLLRALGEAHAEWVTSPYVWEEAERNVRRLFPQHLQHLDPLRELLVIVNDDVLDAKEAKLLPAKDQPVLAAAIRSRCSHLVTGDLKHFGPLMGTSIQGVKVVSQRMLAEELVGD